MKTLIRHFFAATAALLVCAAATTARAQEGCPESTDKAVRANYALAERFSAKKVGQMVFSTRIVPNWFRDSDRFWYEWKDSRGTKYYLIDPEKFLASMKALTEQKKINDEVKEMLKALED